MFRNDVYDGCRSGARREKPGRERLSINIMKREEMKRKEEKKKEEKRKKEVLM